MQTVKIFLVVSVSIAFSCIQLAAAPKQNFVDSNGSRVAEFLKQNFSNGNGGMVIALMDEYGTRVVSAGTLDNGTNRQLDGDTLFEIGSITKTFTSLLLLDMVKRGEMSLDDPVAKYLPENVKVPTHAGKEIALLHLSAQDSGLPFNPDNLADKFWVDAYNEYTQDDLYEFLAAYKLEIDPGERFQYSNVGMTLLGHAIERHTGTDFESLVIDRICRPLKMNDTLITLSPEKTPRVAMGHDIDGNRAPKYDLRVIAPAGGLLSTTNDLLKYVSANLGFVQSDLHPTHERNAADSPYKWRRRHGKICNALVRPRRVQPAGHYAFGTWWGHARGNELCRVRPDDPSSRRYFVQPEESQRIRRGLADPAGHATNDR